MPPSSSEERKIHFSELDPQVQLRFKESFLKIIESVATSRMGTLPALSALCVAMLVVVSLRQDLIPLSDFSVKLLISILLVFIPVSLRAYFTDLNQAMHSAFKSLKEFDGTDLYVEMEKILKEKSCSSKFVALLPDLTTLILLFIVLYILWIMWNDLLPLLLTGILFILSLSEPGNDEST